MSSISIIGSGNMARAIGTLALKGGNTVEVIGRDGDKAGALARALGNGATAGTWGATPTGDIVILAVLFAGAVPVGKMFVDGLITGWHEPGASHLLLLEAVAGAQLVERAYREALAARLLWHEFGDSCLLLPRRTFHAAVA